MRCAMFAELLAHQLSRRLGEVGRSIVDKRPAFGDQITAAVRHPNRRADGVRKRRLSLRHAVILGRLHPCGGNDPLGAV